MSTARTPAAHIRATSPSPATPLTPAQRRLQLTGGAYALMFLVAVQVFMFWPGQLLATLNAISAALFPSLPPAQEAGRFWLSLAASMMYTITALAWLIWRDPVRHAAMALPLVVAKFASSASGAGYFAAGLLMPQTPETAGWATLANLVIATTDLPLGLWLLWCWRQAR